MHSSFPILMLYLRVTARISAMLLAAAFAAPGLLRLLPSPFTAWMAESRHRLILLFALSHTLHLGGIVTLAALAPAHFSSQFLYKSTLAGLIGGALGYVLIYYLAWRAFVQQRNIGSRNSELRDSTLQTVTFYILWAIFTLVFTAGIWRNALIYAPLAAVMWLALVVRICAKLAPAASSQSSVTA